MPVALSEGSERGGGSTNKLDSCRGRNRFAEEQTTMAMDDRRGYDGGYGCGEEGGDSGRFLS